MNENFMSDNNFIIPDFDRDRDEALKITLSKNTDIPGVLNVTLIGRIDNYNTSFFQNKMEKIIAEGYRKILFKCTSLDYISSSGVGVFATSHARLKEINGTFVFLDIQSKVMEVFHLLGFDHLFNITNDIYDLERFFDDENLKTTEVFPKSISCPVCASTLKASRAGKFRCSKCKVIIKIDDNGNVSLS